MFGVCAIFSVVTRKKLYEHKSGFGAFDGHSSHTLSDAAEEEDTSEGP